MRKEKKSHKGTILSAIIVFIMISSVIGFLYGGQTDQYRYKDLKFKKSTAGWTTTINSQQLVFDYFPSDVEQIEMGPEIQAALINRPEIDTTSDINDTFSEEIALAQYNMALVLNELNIYARRGFTTNNTFGLPLISCESASTAVPVIYYQYSNETSLSMENNCIMAKSRNPIDILRLKDRLLYSLLGVTG
jgi:hypothetical protein